MCRNLVLRAENDFVSRHIVCWLSHAMLLVKQSWSSNAFPAESKYIAIMVRRHVPHPLDRDLSPFRTIPPFRTVCLRQAIFSLRGDTIRAERSRVAMVARGDRTPWQRSEERRVG